MYSGKSLRNLKLTSLFAKKSTSLFAKKPAFLFAKIPTFLFAKKSTLLFTVYKNQLMKYLVMLQTGEHGQIGLKEFLVSNQQQKPRKEMEHDMPTKRK